MFQAIENSFAQPLSRILLLYRRLVPSTTEVRNLSLAKCSHLELSIYESSKAVPKFCTLDIRRPQCTKRVILRLHPNSKLQSGVRRTRNRAYFHLHLVHSLDSIHLATKHAARVASPPNCSQLSAIITRVGIGCAGQRSLLVSFRHPSRRIDGIISRNVFPRCVNDD